ncbi:protein of unknown function [Cupriavidus taiwanensis]|uniref:Uncharacterized protein n=2 Tax=Cupriavidus taiwanensis TaxID=164546 RepID=A0A9Q7XRJ4_9BURK|nr:protein of unknown function [Cupriavidus taiwanensis]
MRTEAGILQEWTTARRMVKDIIDGPDADIDRIIRSVRDNQGTVSNKLRKEFPVLENVEIVTDLVGALKTAFKHFDGGSPTSELPDEHRLATEPVRTKREPETRSARIRDAEDSDGDKSFGEYGVDD